MILRVEQTTCRQGSAFASISRIFVTKYSHSLRFVSLDLYHGTREDIFAFASLVDDIAKIYSHSLRKMHVVANDANIFANNGKITYIS